jgi:hypothetical protein
MQMSAFLYCLLSGLYFPNQIERDVGLEKKKNSQKIHDGNCLLLHTVFIIYFITCTAYMATPDLIILFYYMGTQRVDILVLKV